MKRYLSIIILALSSCLFAGMGAQERGNSAYRTSTWSLYAEGGATMAHGLGMSSVDAAPGMNIVPEIGAGVSFNIRPWIRLGVNYDFSKYAREQRFSEFQPLEIPAGEGTLSEQYGGLVYSKMWTHYHAADLTLEFNIMPKLFVANVSSVVVGVSIIVWIPMAVGLWGVVSMAVKPNMFECPMPIKV